MGANVADGTGAEGGGEAYSHLDGTWPSKFSVAARDAGGSLSARPKK